MGKALCSPRAAPALVFATSILYPMPKHCLGEMSEAKTALPARARFIHSRTTDSGQLHRASPMLTTADPRRMEAARSEEETGGRHVSPNLIMGVAAESCACTPARHRRGT